MYTLRELFKTAQENKACINERWVPARPINWKCRTWRERLREAWLVFKGRADAFTWPEGQ